MAWLVENGRDSAMPAVSCHGFEALLGRKVNLAELDILFHIHVPKAGGNTVMQLARQNGFAQLDLHVTSNDFFHWIDERRWFAAQRDRVGWRPHFLSGHFRLDHAIFKKMQRPYGTITTLRHPIDRLLSNYNFTLRFPRTPFHDDVISGRMSFVEHALHFASAFGTQYSYFDDTGDGTLSPTGTADAQRCLDNLLTKISFYGFVDRMKEFAVVLGYLFGFSNVMNVGTHNRTAAYPDLGMPLKDCVTDDERDVLQSKLADDLWFYEHARAEYARRLSDKRLRHVIARAMPLVDKCEQLQQSLFAIEDIDHPGRSAFPPWV